MSDKEKLPGPVREYTTFIGAYLVAIGVGLAPFLGAKHVPGFTSIGELFPMNMQRGLIAFATFLMLIPIITVQFYAEDDVRRSNLNRMFTFFFLPLLVVVPFVLYYFFSIYVIQVDFEGGQRSASYVVGSHMLPDCPCVALGLRMTTCIGPVLSANPAGVTACYDDAEINRRRMKLAVPYLLMMLSLGAAVALIVMKRIQRKRASGNAEPVPA